MVDLTGIEPTGTQTGTGDRENRDREEHDPSPLLAAVVACCAADSNVDEKNDAVDDDTAVQVSDAALSVVHALSHGGWRGWGDAVRAHAILPAAVDACDAAFRRRAACSNGVGSDSSTADGVKAERRVKSALMLVARLLAEPGSAARAIASLRRDGETARTLARVAAAGWGAPGADAEEGRAVFRVVAADGDAAGWRVMGRELDDDDDGHTTAKFLDLRFHHALPKCFNNATIFSCFWSRQQPTASHHYWRLCECLHRLG